MHYHICEAQSAKALQEDVAHLIAKGWRPAGGVSVVNSHNSGTWWYYQAMVFQREEAYASGSFADEIASSDPEFS
jgi:Domain of unknown function (DUF1737)